MSVGVKAAKKGRDYRRIEKALACGMIGRVFDRLTVVAFSHSDNGRCWVCKCACGTEGVIRRNNTLTVSNGYGISCGCLNKKIDRLDGLAKCGKCKRKLPISAFNKCATFKRNGIQSGCRECQRKWRRKNKKLLQESKRKYYRKNRKHIAAKARENRHKNRAGDRRRSARWRARHPERRRRSANAWARRNRLYGLIRVSHRRAVLLQAVPIWANAKKVEAFYIKGRKKNLTVDHIVPLVSKLVCGLHWEGNFQLLTQAANTAKGNRCWPDMP